MIFKSADVVQAVSPHLARFAIEMGFAGTPIVIPNGVNCAVFASAVQPGDLEDVRRRVRQILHEANDDQGSPVEEDVYVVSASRLVPKNGLPNLIAAMQFLPKHVKLIILGDGPDMVRFRSQAAAMAIGSRVVFVGAVDQVEIPKYFGISSVFVRASVWEGFGNSFIEAMAHGVPVIATPVGGIVDFVFDPDANPGREPTGLFAVPGSPESIAEKIRLLISNEQLRARLVQNGRRTAVENYDWNAITGRMRRECFEKLVGLSVPDCQQSAV
jgi:glycosyltransferase involved in cell wall biosynthesis